MSGSFLVPHRKPDIKHISTVASSRMFTIEAVDLVFSNGVQTQYERLRGSKYGAVLIVPLLDDDTLLLIREYSVGSERYELGFPKGRIEKQELITAAANREIMEEVGYAARQLQVLRTITLAPGFTCAITHIVLARDLYPQRCAGDEPESLEVIPWKLSEYRALLAAEEFTEVRSIAALYMVKEYLENA